MEAINYAPEALGRNAKCFLLANQAHQAKLRPILSLKPATHCTALVVGCL